MIAITQTHTHAHMTIRTTNFFRYLSSRYSIRFVAPQTKVVYIEWMKNQIRERRRNKKKTNKITTILQYTDRRYSALLWTLSYMKRLQKTFFIMEIWEYRKSVREKQIWFSYAIWDWRRDVIHCKFIAINMLILHTYIDAFIQTEHTKWNESKNMQYFFIIIFIHREGRDQQVKNRRNILCDAHSTRRWNSRSKQKQLSTSFHIIICINKYLETESAVLLRIMTVSAHLTFALLWICFFFLFACMSWVQSFVSLHLVLFTVLHCAIQL